MSSILQHAISKITISLRSSGMLSSADLFQFGVFILALLCLSISPTRHLRDRNLAPSAHPKYRIPRINMPSDGRARAAAVRHLSRTRRGHRRRHRRRAIRASPRCHQSARRQRHRAHQEAEPRRRSAGFAFYAELASPRPPHVIAMAAATEGGTSVPSAQRTPDHHEPRCRILLVPPRSLTRGSHCR